VDLDDLEVDIPMASKIVAQFIGIAVLDDSLSLSYLNEGLKPLIESDKALKIALECISTIFERTVSH
jgi:hypothetical protein